MRNKRFSAAVSTIQTNRSRCVKTGARMPSVRSSSNACSMSGMGRSLSIAWGRSSRESHRYSRHPHSRSLYVRRISSKCSYRCCHAWLNGNDSSFFSPRRALAGKRVRKNVIRPTSSPRSLTTQPHYRHVTLHPM